MSTVGGSKPPPMGPPPSLPVAAGGSRGELLLAELAVGCAALLLLGPPVAFVLGRAAAASGVRGRAALLVAACAAAAALVCVVGLGHRSWIAALVRGGALDRLQWAVVLVAVVAVAVPRLLALDPAVPVAVYDDHWHFQKMVSVFGSFPDLRHYLFPDLRLSYSFYGYLIPAALYALAPVVPLKALWALYVPTVAACSLVLMLVLLNPLVGASRLGRGTLAVALALAGGLHEWPWLLHRALAGGGGWHSEWWARKLGLDVQLSSPFSTAFWAPQHLLGLALFAVMFRLARARPTVPRSAALGALLGVLAGFSVWVALAAALYLALWGLQLAVAESRKVAGYALAGAVAGAAALAPILPFLAHRSGGLWLAASPARIALWPLFLAVELGLLLPLLVVGTAAAMGRDGGSDRRRDALFVVCMLLVPLLVHSEGVNVLSYRGLLPAQLVLAVIAAQAASWLVRGGRLRRGAVAAIACLQVTAFLPEAAAMSRNELVARTRSRLPESILRVNAEPPVDEVVRIPYWPGVDGRTLNGDVLHLYRMKDLDRSYYCAGLVDENNLVYLNRIDRARLDAGCGRHD